MEEGHLLSPQSLSIQMLRLKVLHAQPVADVRGGGLTLQFQRKDISAVSA